MDGASRYLLGLEATTSTREQEAWPVFAGLFETYGLPDRFRSDNGSPFASAGIAGLTPLSVRLIKLGITLERIAPGKPQQNGRHERFHLSMLPLAQNPQADRAAQQRAFDAFRCEYNQVRPMSGPTPAPAAPPLARGGSGRGAACSLLAIRFAIRSKSNPRPLRPR